MRSNVTIVDNGTSYLPRLVALAGPHVDVMSYQDTALSKVSKGIIVLSGGHGTPVAVEPERFTAEIELLHSTTLPVLGICLGFELMVYVHKGILKRMPERERGVLEIKVIQDDPVFAGTSQFRVFESHRWVAQSLGPDLLALAESKDGYEIVRHRTRLQYGFQFHPEMFERAPDGTNIFHRTLEYLRS